MLLLFEGLRPDEALPNIVVRVSPREGLSSPADCLI